MEGGVSADPGVDRPRFGKRGERIAAEQNANARVIAVHLRHTEAGQQTIERPEKRGVGIDMI
jgi:hypothetical protein